LKDEETGRHYLIELKIGGDLDNKKARAEKEALLEQYAILVNTLGAPDNVFVRFATAYHRFGEGKPWEQGRVRQYFAAEELLIGKDFWDFVCKTKSGYEKPLSGGAPEGIRTPDLCLRRAALYPAELRAQNGGWSGLDSETAAIRQRRRLAARDSAS
jgi:hypothetical protein